MQTAIYWRHGKREGIDAVPWVTLHRLNHSDWPSLPLTIFQIHSIALNPPRPVTATAVVTWAVVTFLSVPYIMQSNNCAINLIATWGTCSELLSFDLCFEVCYVVSLMSTEVNIIWILLKKVLAKQKLHILEHSLGIWNKILERKKWLTILDTSDIDNVDLKRQSATTKITHLPYYYSSDLASISSWGSVWVNGWVWITNK